MDEHPLHPGHKSSPCVKGVIVDGGVGAHSLVVNSTISNLGGVSSNSSFSIL